MYGGVLSGDLAMDMFTRSASHLFAISHPLQSRTGTPNANGKSITP